MILMGYYNPLLAYGLEAFVADAARSGVDGLIAVDLPPEEGEELRGLCAARGLDLVFLLAPTSDEGRIRLVVERASGFVYCVSVTGVTGAREALRRGCRSSCGAYERIHRFRWPWASASADESTWRLSRGWPRRRSWAARSSRSSNDPRRAFEKRG